MPTRVLLPFVLVSFAANSLITRHVVGQHLLDPGLLTCVRFLAGALALGVLALSRRERPAAGRTNLLPALWLGVYAICISYGYEHIGAAAGTFVFYATVQSTLALYDVARGVAVPRTRIVGAAIALVGLAVLASSSVKTVTATGVLLLAATGAAWGLYTAAGRGVPAPRVASTGNFLALSALLLPWAVVLGAGDARTTAEGFVWAAVMGAGTTAFAYVAWYACQRSLSATAAGTVQLVIPVLTAVGAVVLLDEPFTTQLAIAGALVALGMWLSGRRPATSRASR
jgi:drug/metabolite transporter (DMT)-like permease